MRAQELDEDEKAIRDWILKNPRKTENEVAAALMKEGQCHRLTTLKKIRRLKERSILEDVRAKPNSFSCLVVKDDNEYTRIYQVITKIKMVIDAMDEPIKKLFLQRSEWGMNPTTKEAMRGAYPLQVLQSQVESKYRQSYTLMLQFLWDRTDNVIQSEKDKQDLHTRIVNLMMRINRQFWYPRELNEIFKFYMYSPEVLKLSLSKKVGITKGLIDELNITQEDFVTHFLT